MAISQILTRHNKCKNKEHLNKLINFTKIEIFKTLRQIHRTIVQFFLI